MATGGDVVDVDAVHTGYGLLSEPESRFHDLGADYYQSQINTRRRQRDLIRQLEHLTGQTVVLRATA
ncbi:MAG: hypothetical protein WCF04_15095 [Candidatus Nanopelagicales bacterium]